MAARLTLEGLGEHRAGRDRSFALTVERLTLEPGDRLLLAGPNGCGKSTLLELIGLALMPDAALRFELADGKAAAVDLFGLWRRGRRDQLRQAARPAHGLSAADRRACCPSSPCARTSSWSSS